MSSERPMTWPTTDRETEDGAPVGATSVRAKAHADLAMKREVEALRERVAQLEADNERLTVALRGRGEVVHSTLPLRSINVADIALYAGSLRTPRK